MFAQYDAENKYLRQPIPVTTTSTATLIDFPTETTDKQAHDPPVTASQLHVDLLGDLVPDQIPPITGQQIGSDQVKRETATMEKSSALAGNVLDLGAPTPKNSALMDLGTGVSNDNKENLVNSAMTLPPPIPPRAKLPVQSATPPKEAQLIDFS